MNDSSNPKNVKQPHAVDNRPRCDAKIKRGERKGQPCGSPFVMAGNKCRAHGGASKGAPKENKNAETTGEYSKLILAQLDPDEQAAMRDPIVEKRAAIEHEIKLTDIRIARMLKRINAIRASGLSENEAPTETGMTVTEETVEVIEGGGQAPAPGFSGDLPVEAPPAGESVVTKTRKKREGKLGQIQAIEDGLTRVQAHKARLVELLHKLDMEKASENPTDGLNALATAIAESAKLAGGAIPQITAPNLDDDEVDGEG